MEAPDYALDEADEEIERLKAIIEKIRSHSRPMRYVVEWAEGKRDDKGKVIDVQA